MYIYIFRCLILKMAVVGGPNGKWTVRAQAEKRPGESCLVPRSPLTDIRKSTRSTGTATGIFSQNRTPTLLVDRLGHNLGKLQKIKSSSLNDRSIRKGKRGGGGVNALAIKEKITFFRTFFSNVPKFQRPLSLRGEVGLALVARPLIEELFLRLPLVVTYYCYFFLAIIIIW